MHFSIYILFLAFDKEWATNGLIDKVVDLFEKYIKDQPIKGLTYEVVRAEGRTPLIFIEVAATDQSFDR